jgi:hypothetical protein
LKTAPDGPQFCGDAQLGSQPRFLDPMIDHDEEPVGAQVMVNEARRAVMGDPKRTW